MMTKTHRRVLGAKEASHADVPRIERAGREGTVSLECAADWADAHKVYCEAIKAAEAKDAELGPDYFDNFKL